VTKGKQAAAVDGKADPFGALQKRLKQVSRKDHARLSRRVRGARKIKQRGRKAKVAEELAAEITKAESRLARRVAAIPACTYPAELPITQRREELLEAIRDNQVVVIAGETGSGKSTQLPKI